MICFSALSLLPRPGYARQRPTSLHRAASRAMWSKGETSFRERERARAYTLCTLAAANDLIEIVRPTITVKATH